MFLIELCMHALLGPLSSLDQFYTAYQNEKIYSKMYSVVFKQIVGNKLFSYIPSDLSNNMINLAYDRRSEQPASVQHRVRFHVQVSYVENF